MNHKNPVSGTGDGVLYLDIMKKYANCPDCRFWQEIVRRESDKLGADFEYILNFAGV